MEFKIEDVNINGIPLKKIFFSNIILETEAPDEYSRMFPNIIQVTDEDTETLAISFQKNRMEHRICIPQGGLVRRERYTMDCGSIRHSIHSERPYSDVHFWQRICAKLRGQRGVKLNLTVPNR